MEDLTVNGEVLRDLMDDVAEPDPYGDNNMDDMGEESVANMEEEADMEEDEWEELKAQQSGKIAVLYP